MAELPAGMIVIFLDITWIRQYLFLFCCRADYYPGSELIFCICMKKKFPTSSILHLVAVYQEKL